MILIQKIRYPPKEITEPSGLEKKDFEYIILWMLCNNEGCNWSCFLNPPLKYSLATLSKYMNQLITDQCVEKVSKGTYKITSKGQKRYNNRRFKTQGTSLRYPPKVILNKRNYSHIIIWMLFNNEECKRVDFLEKPLQINHHSLTKTLNTLKSENLITIQDNKYEITEPGKTKYQKILKKYQLDIHTLIKEEIEHLEEVKNIATEFLETTQVSDKIKFIFVDWLNNFPHKSIKTVIPEEIDFHKVLLFLSINHPLSYPLYIPLDQFSKEYEINKSILDFFLENTMISTDFGFKFFKIRLSEQQSYYFRESDKFEKRLRMILDEFIQSHSYLRPIQSTSSEEELEIQSADLLQKVTLEVSKLFFNSSLKSSLLYFLKGYITFLHEIAQKKGFTDDILENYKQVLYENIAKLNIDDIPELEKKKYKLTSILGEFPRFTVFDKLKNK